MITVCSLHPPTLALNNQAGLVAANYNTFDKVSFKYADITVTGKATDTRGDGLPGVTVVLKGTSNGTTTDPNGSFKLNIPEASGTLVFSFIGYASQEVSLGGRTTLNVTLKEDARALEEVVVVGYGTMKKSDLTGASSAIKGTELRKTPVPTAAEAITGRLAGVQVQTTDGQPGADIMLKIRGGTSVSQDNSPLYIIDGFPSERGLVQISPNDIERIDILKDASSTAIYGARGANGVVLITTKGGKEGKVEITYDGYAGIKKFRRKLDVLSPYEYAVYQYERTRTGGTAAQEQFLKRYGTWEDLEGYKEAEGIDWQDKTFGRNAFHQSHNIGINGGTKTTKYRIGYSRDDEQGIMVANGYSRDYFKLKLDQQVTERLSLSTNILYSQRTTKGAGTSGTQDKGRLKNAVMYRPILGLNESNDDLENLEYDPEVSLSNPITQAEAQYRMKFNKNTVLNASFDYKLTDALTFRLLGGMNLDFDRNEEFDKSGSSDVRSHGGPFGGIEIRDAGKYNNTALLTYKKTFNTKHEVNALIGQEYVYNKYQMVGAYSSMYDNDDIGINNLALGNEHAKPQSREEHEKLLSFFGRVFYSFNNRYLFTGTVRADGSSKFIGANRWGYFPSLSFAWQANEEEFVKNLNIFSDLKLRLSYGVAGNNRIANNRYSSTFTNAFYAADGTSLSVGLIPNSVANPSLKWEATYSRNVGFDFGFFQNRITANVDMYYNDTKDLLLNANIPASSGYTTQFKNVGSTQNKGIETTLTTRNIQTAKFNWTTDFNISFFKSKITGLNKEADFEQESALYPSNYAINIYDYLVKVGEPLGVIYGYVTEGFYGVDDFNYDNATQKYTLKDGIAALSSVDRNTVQPGDIKFKDLGGQLDANGNPTLSDDDDRTILGRTNPKFFGGLNNTFTYKGFDLSVFMNFSVGNKILNANKILFTTASNDYQNVLGIMRDRFRTINDEGQIVTDPDALRELNKDATIWKWQGGLPRWTHSWAVEDGSFLRINNITLGYTLPANFSNKIFMKGLRVYATAYNIYTLTNYSGFDPEVNTLRSSPFTPGVDHSGFPKSFSAIAGFNITF
ncbi:SusC/RagA family TonB-linked outer membrane protein [Adhaeribacter aerolatus]|uniref:SusC/RagA family TonB-linked outer membrane protein n=2 Tax=Adhaeribacter aerolatus TaxID=670289 RepID=A0A512AW52_9BACT|nr:SusC/RagA family TonB-linked outer membrane protein [Adhaeribacter aerolatus]